MNQQLSIKARRGHTTRGSCWCILRLERCVHHVLSRCSDVTESSAHPELCLNKFSQAPLGPHGNLCRQPPPVLILILESKKSIHSPHFCIYARTRVHYVQLPELQKQGARKYSISKPANEPTSKRERLENKTAGAGGRTGAFILICAQTTPANVFVIAAK
jgi:hypothetical protein